MKPFYDEGMIADKEAYNATLYNGVKHHNANCLASMKFNALIEFNIAIIDALYTKNKEKAIKTILSHIHKQEITVTENIKKVIY